MSKSTLPGWSVPVLASDLTTNLASTSLHITCWVEPFICIGNGQRQHVHPRDSCLQWLQDSIRSSESPECRRSFWCKSIWFENNCTVCGRGAPVQGAETLRQKKCNEYTWFYHKKKQERIFWHTQRTSKTKVSSSHLTQPQAIHILSFWTISSLSNALAMVSAVPEARCKVLESMGIRLRPSCFLRTDLQISSGWWTTNPFEKYARQNGFIFPN